MNGANPKPSMLKVLVRPFVAGVVALLPIVLTFAVIAWLALFLVDLVGPGSTVGKALLRAGRIEECL